MKIERSKGEWVATLRRSGSEIQAGRVEDVVRRRAGLFHPSESGGVQRKPVWVVFQVQSNPKQTKPQTMLSTLFSLVLLVAAPGNTGELPLPESSKNPTHQLTVNRMNADCLFINGEAVTSDYKLGLKNPNVGTKKTSGNFQTVTLADGRTFYKGDFELAVQSKESGTIQVQICDGELVLSPVKG